MRSRISVILAQLRSTSRCFAKCLWHQSRSNCGAVHPFGFSTSRCSINAQKMCLALPGIKIPATGRSTGLISLLSGSRLNRFQSARRWSLCEAPIAGPYTTRRDLILSTQPCPFLKLRRVAQAICRVCLISKQPGIIMTSCPFQLSPVT